ncbi:MAG: helical backbone metal receptor [Saprospiraceae bacterium]
MIFIDQLQRQVKISSPVQRIISIVPSQTELLYQLGLEEQVVGITKFCIHPSDWFKNKTKVGGTKKLKLELIESLNPDLIIANKEENNEQDIEWIAKRFPVWISDISNVKEAFHMIDQLGLICNRKKEAIIIMDKIDKARNELQLLKTNRKISVCYLIWKDPYMSIGKDTFIHSMLEEAGFKNVFGNRTRYPITNLEEIQSLNPDYVFLSSEPYPFKATESEVFKTIKTIKVDGEAFSWYGSHLIMSFYYLCNLISLIR